MNINAIVPSGSLILLTSGEYGDFGVNGLYRTVGDVDMQALFTEFIATGAKYELFEKWLALWHPDKFSPVEHFETWSRRSYTEYLVDLSSVVGGREDGDAATLETPLDRERRKSSLETCRHCGRVAFGEQIEHITKSGKKHYPMICDYCGKNRYSDDGTLDGNE